MYSSKKKYYWYDKEPKQKKQKNQRIYIRLPLAVTQHASTKKMYKNVWKEITSLQQTKNKNFHGVKFATYFI